MYENRAHCDYTQYSYYYVVTTDNPTQNPSLTENESRNKTKVQWHSLIDTVDLIFNQTPSTNQQKFLKARDVAALQKYMEK